MPRELRPRWKRGVAAIEVRWARRLGKLYVAKHFPPAAKSRMKQLVANLIEAYRRDIQDARLDERRDKDRRHSRNLPSSRPRSATPTHGATTRRSRSGATTSSATFTAAEAFELDRETWPSSASPLIAASGS